MPAWLPTVPRPQLFERWNNSYKNIQELTNKSLTAIHYNIRYFLSNQLELLQIINHHQPTIISLNELGSSTNIQLIEQLLPQYQIIKAAGENRHGGVVLAIHKEITYIPIDINKPNIAAAILIINKSLYTVASIYSPPKASLPLETMSLLLKYAKNILLFGDFNAKHTSWRCSTINSKGAQLENWLNTNKLLIHNSNMRTSLRSSTNIDLIISNDQPGSVDCSLLPYNCSDHFPIFIEFSNILFTNKQNQTIPKTYWNVFRVILEVIYEHLEEIYHEIQDETQIFSHFQYLLQALKTRVTIFNANKSIRPTLPPSIRILLKYKHYLQNRYRKTKLEHDRLNLR